MENKTDKQTQEELRTDYGHRSIFILLFIFSGCKIIHIISSKFFLFCLTLGFMLMFPFVFWLFTDNILTFHLSVLLCLPAHYFLVMREMEEEKSEMERIEMRDQSKVACIELWRMINEKLK